MGPWSENKSGGKGNTESETCMQQGNGISSEGNQGGNDPKKPPLCMNKEVSKSSNDEWGERGDEARLLRNWS